MPDPLQSSGKYTPLRYPGGKGKLAKFVKSLVVSSNLSDGVYVEPFAGGAAIAVELLLEAYVSRIEINDKSRGVYAFWHSVVTAADELSRLIYDTPLDLVSWDKQKQVQRSPDAHSILELGFSTFFLNRTNRSGILNAGVIGGRAQTGTWLIDARYNAADLVRRVQNIAKFSDRISVHNLDAVELISESKGRWGKKTLLYLDPPYYVKGKHLYYDYYRHADHLAVRDAVLSLRNVRWMVSYDDVPEISEMYAGQRWLRYTIGYSARRASVGSEVMFFSPDLQIPAAMASMVEVAREQGELLASS